MKNLLIMFFLLFLGINCSKEGLQETPHTVEGTYLGTIYESSSSADGMGNTYSFDTSSVDSFDIELITTDSILFGHRNSNWKFKIDISDNYVKWNGTHSNEVFNISRIDTLKYSYWSYGGAGGAYSQVNKDFVGIK